MVNVLRVAGLILLVFGITFLFWGFDLSQSFSNRFMREMAGEYPEQTKKYIFGGIAMLVVGIGCLVYSFKRRD